jgi:hypothetical protein
MGCFGGNLLVEAILLEIIFIHGAATGDMMGAATTLTTATDATTGTTSTTAAAGSTNPSWSRQQHFGGQQAPHGPGSQSSFFSSTKQQPSHNSRNGRSIITINNSHNGHNINNSNNKDDRTRSATRSRRSIVLQWQRGTFGGVGGLGNWTVRYDTTRIINGGTTDDYGRIVLLDGTVEHVEQSGDDTRKRH